MMPADSAQPSHATLPGAVAKGGEKAEPRRRKRETARFKAAGYFHVYSDKGSIIGTEGCKAARSGGKKENIGRLQGMED
ncbi:Hypothetical predicted protein [Podarcis lilfordi]|uniref:Uncharacterized protein n=1 Tax=Podarcis lilfordi TaxID=74358 RepID=A0AA35LFQ6_9SAUR|nr:Hypothetical predicted protein [Podarcis lilfordi]